MVDALCQSLPRARFIKQGNMLSVTTTYGGFKVLANADGIKYLRENEPSKVPIDTKVCIFYCSPSSLNKILNLFSLCFISSTSKNLLCSYSMPSNIHPVNDKVENIYNHLILAFLFSEYIIMNPTYKLCILLLIYCFME